jgi:anthranilate synthase component 1
MEAKRIRVIKKQILADLLTPVGIYLRIRDIFPSSLLLEGADYQAGKNSYSFICIDPVASFKVENNNIYIQNFENEIEKITILNKYTFSEKLFEFINSFNIENSTNSDANGLFGYIAYDSVKYFEDIKIKGYKDEYEKIADAQFCLYRFIIAINHFKNTLEIIENIIEDKKSEIENIETLLTNRSIITFPFSSVGKEISGISDHEYINLVTKGKEHCYRGDVFQIVLSRQFQQKYKGDDFNVYRALRSINPSPYLFYFDYGNFRIFGSSPETQIEIRDKVTSINPIAGTFKRTGNDEHDKELAKKLADDPKENAEHVMLVDLARNDLSRNAKNVKVESYKEIHYYSHVIHMVSKVTGILPKEANPIQVIADTFPAGTLSGAPKFKAMELINKYENKNRGYYGGCIGYIGFDGTVNMAIMIRSFLSKNNTLFYQAGAGIVSESKEESELNEVNNKLAALKSAIILANNMK